MVINNGLTNTTASTASQRVQTETWTAAVREKLVGMGAMRAGEGLSSELLGALSDLSKSSHGSVVFDFLGSITSDTAGSTDRLTSAVNQIEHEELRSAIADLLASVRDPETLSRLLIEFAANARKMALDSRLAARAEAKGELQTQAGKTRDAAAKTLEAAETALVFAVVAFVVTAVASGISIGQLKSAGNAAAKAGKYTDMAMNVTSASQKPWKTALENTVEKMEKTMNLKLRQVDVTGQVGQALSSVTNAIGSYESAKLDAASKTIEAEGQSIAAEAQDTQADADMFKQFLDELAEMLRAALQHHATMEQMESEQMATASKL